MKSTPPPIAEELPLNSISRYLVSTTGFNTAPLPFPPSMVADNTSLTSKDCGSTNTSWTLPETTALAKAVVPEDGDAIVIVGGFTTSYSVPPL